MRELIRRDRERLALRGLVLDALASEDAGEMDAEYFDELRAIARRRAADVA